MKCNEETMDGPLAVKMNALYFKSGGDEARPVSGDRFKPVRIRIHGLVSIDAVTHTAARP